MELAEGSERRVSFGTYGKTDDTPCLLVRNTLHSAAALPEEGTRSLAVQ